MTKFRSLLLFILLVSVPALLLLAGCEHKKNNKLPNIRPSVKVSGGPPQGGTSTYSVPIYWFAWDDDGVVDHFLYAIDDTTVWTETKYFQGSFLFTADSLRSGNEFGRWHTFWIKAVDNEGAVSYPDYLAFDARTLAPKTTIKSPTCDTSNGTILCWGARPVGLSVKVVWEGEDLDSRDPKQLPVGYRWRLFNLTKAGYSQQGCPDEATCAQLLDSRPYFPDSSSYWSNDTTATSIIFSNLQAGAFWLFGVRAIDEADAVEPNLVLWSNVTYFRTMNGYGIPSLSVCLGSNCQNFPGDTWVIEAPVGRQLTFSWLGDASAYGGTITGYTYGVDIEDLNDPTEWEGWSSEVKSASVIFNEPGVHYFYVKVRDYADVETIAVVEIDVVQFLFDRDLLYLDDFYDQLPDDRFHDAFVKSSFGRYHAYTDTMYSYAFLPPGGGGAQEMPGSGAEISLAELTRYKVVIWDCFAPLTNYDCCLNRNVQNGVLDAYLNGGGRLCVYGTQVLKGTDTDLSYPTDMSDSKYADTFVYKYLKISGQFNRSFDFGVSYRGDGFQGAFPNRRLSGAIPALDVDHSMPSVTTYGLWQIEAVMTAMQEADLTQRPDTVYFFHSYRTSSSYYNKACALRYFDTYANSKVVWMGFPIQWFYAQQAESLGTFVMDWMFEDLYP